MSYRNTSALLTVPNQSTTVIMAEKAVGIQTDPSGIVYESRRERRVGQRWSMCCRSVQSAGANPIQCI